MKHFKKSILTLLCWSLCATLTAQTPVIDSLENVLATAKLKNQEKAVLLINLSNAFMFGDTAKWRTYSMDALQLAQNAGLKLEEGRAHIALGIFYSINLSFYQAHTHFVNAEKIFYELNEKERLLGAYNNMTSMFRMMPDFDNAAYYARKTQELAIEMNNYTGMLNAQLTLGEALYHEKYNQEALDYYLDLYQRSLHIEDSLNLAPHASALAGFHCGLNYAHLKQYQEAIPYFQKRILYDKAQGFINTVAVTYINIAYVYSLMHNVDSAEYYINKAMDYPIIYHSTFSLYGVKAKIDSLKGDYRSALANFQKFHHIKDSISKAGASTEMARIKLWHEFDQKEVEKRILQKEYHKQRKLSTTLAIALVAIAALLALVVFFYRKIRENNGELNKKNHIITEKNGELEELHTVKDKLFSVVAHDLRSPMASLMSILKLTHMNVLDAETQAQMLNDVSKRVDDVYGLLDNLLRWAKSQMQGMVISPVYFDVQNEIHAVMDGLQEIAAAKMVALNNRVRNHEIFTDRDMFSVVVRNLATNALKYTSAGGEVTIDSELTDDMLVVSVKDTGTGMPQEIQNKLFKLSETESRRGTNNESGTGLGLVLCADLVKANGGRIWFNSEQGEGSTFFFSIPTK